MRILLPFEERSRHSIRDELAKKPTGVAMERSRVREVEWRKLSGVVVAGSVIGRGMILAVAVGLSHL
jgi:hypothetical protein